MAEKILIGMSGGVDSSVAAYLLKEQGYEVIGVTMCMTRNEGVTNPGVDAKKVADMLGIKHIMLDFSKQFSSLVEDYFVNEYLHARTPNPCVECNHTIKWKALLEQADELGAKYIATGHYAKIVKNIRDRYTLQKAEALLKDQTYALCRLSQSQLMRTKMPLGEFESKEDIRKIAQQIGLAVAKKPDSMEICFIPDNDYCGYIERRLDEKDIPPKGNFVLKDGTVVGQHQGIIHYTIGQRKGLNIAFGHPVFVSRINPKTNEVVLGDNEDVYVKKLKCNQLNFMGIEDLQENRNAIVKIRYAHAGSEAVLIRTGVDEITCEFAEPVRAVTPGQAAVFYEDNTILGSGIIE